MTYYNVLGVPQSASEADIKSAYRKLAAKHHPDKGGDSEKFKQIGEAYNTLKDRNARAQYDSELRFSGQRQRHTQSRQRGPFRSEHFDFSGGFGPEDIQDIFRHFQGAETYRQNHAAGTGQSKRNRDVRVTLHIPLEDTLQVQSKTISVDTGDSDPQTLYVTIPRGAVTGTRIKYPGLGDNMFMSLPRGDLFVDIVVDEHPRFSYNNTNLYTVIEISAIDAMLGGETEVVGLDGKRFNLKIHPGTQPNVKMRIANQGLYHQGSEVRGHLYVTVNVNIPKNLTNDQKELLKKLQDSLNTKNGED